MTVNYYINGVTFSFLGVGVSQSRGLIDALKIREPKKMVWPEHHGEVVDLTNLRYEAREIVLDCFIKADTATAFILAVQAFIAAFQKDGLQRLMIEVDDGVATRKPLLYQVYLSEAMKITKNWSATKMAGAFSLTLREPEPVKKVYSIECAPGFMTVSFAITSTSPINIYWGDGNVNNDVTTASGTVTHTYLTGGTKYIVLTGNIENITAITTGAALVWNKL